MLGIHRTAARYTWTAAVVVLLLVMIYQVRSTLFVFTLAVLFAYLLSPAVDLLDRALPSRARTLALAMVYIFFIAVMVVAITQIGSRVVKEAHALAEKFPAMIASWQQQIAQKPDANASLQ